MSIENPSVDVFVAIENSRAYAHAVPCRSTLGFALGVGAIVALVFKGIPLVLAAKRREWRLMCRWR
jgi:hypothetical protein